MSNKIHFSHGNFLPLHVICFNQRQRGVWMRICRTVWDPPMAWKEFGKDIWYPKLKQFTHKHVMPWWLYLNVKWQINITYLMLCNSYIITIRETYRLGPCNSVVLAHSQNKSEHKQLPILTHSLPIRVTVTEALYNIKICAHMFMCVDEGNSGAPQC